MNTSNNNSPDRLRSYLKYHYTLKSRGVLVQNNFSPEALNKAFKEMLDITFHRPQNSYIELTKYRKYVPCLLYEMANLLDEIENIEEYHKREKTDGKSSGKHHKRWTKEEDEWLIESVCMEESLMKIAICLGRTVSSVQGRISYLVGVKRLSQQIAGKFIGTVNGEESEVQLEGTLYKE